MQATTRNQPLDLALPIMHVAPHRTMSTAYVSVDNVGRFEELRQAASGHGVALSLLYTFWDATQERYVGIVVIDQTDSQMSPQQLADELGRADGVKVLASGDPGLSVAAFEHHRLNVAGTPVAVVGLPYLGLMYRRLLEEMGDQAASVLRESGQSAGEQAAMAVAGLLPELGLELTPELTRARFYDLQVFSWATVVDLKLDDRMTGETTLDGTFESAAWNGEASSSTCHWIRGFVGGVLSTIAGEQIRVSEPECQAKGDQYCRLTFER